MNFYQTLTLLIVAILPLFPRQLDDRIPYIIIASGIIFLPLFRQKARHRIYEDTPVTLFLIFLIVLAFSTIFSVDQKRSLIQLATYISYFVIFTSVGSIFHNFKSKERLALVILIVTCLLSLISLYNTLIAHYVNRESMGVSFLWVYYGHNHLSALLIFAIPIAFYFLKTYWKTRLQIPGTSYQAPLLITYHLSLITLLLVALYFSFARASQISLAITIVISLALLRKISKTIVITGFLILVLAFGTYLGLQTDPEKFGIRKVEITSPARPIYFKQAILNAKSHPLFGTGLDTFRFISLNSKDKTLKTFYAHNFFLQILSDAGIFAFLASVALIGSILWRSAKKFAVPYKVEARLWRQKSIVNSQLSTVLFAGLLASTINTLVDFDWQLPTVFLIFWIIAGLANQNYLDTKVNKS